MAGIKALRRIQLGKETTPGTAVAATTIWRGTGTIEDQREVKFVEEDIGLLQRSNRSYTPKLQAALAMDEVEATFEQLPYILAAAVDGVVTGTQDGTGSGYIYQYAFATTTANTIKTFTIEGGDNQQAEEVEYAFVTSFRLSGESQGAVMMQAEWIGRQATPTTFTPSLSVPNVEEILFGKAKLYIDDPGDIGTTEVSQTMLGFELSVEDTGLKPVWTADGNLYFSFHKQLPAEATLEVTFEHNSSAVAEIAKWRTEEPRAMRLLIEGSDLQTAGTYSKKTLQIDCWGKWEKFSQIDERDGNDIVTGTLRLLYDPTDAKFCEITVVNELTSLP